MQTKSGGRRKIILPLEQQNYITEMTEKGWAPDVIIGRKERIINCFSRILYRRFKDKTFDANNLPLKGKRKPNGHQERRGKQAFKRNIAERLKEYSNFANEFGHLEDDTIVGVNHKIALSFNLSITDGIQKHGNEITLYFLCKKCKHSSSCQI